VLLCLSSCSLLFAFASSLSAFFLVLLRHQAFLCVLVFALFPPPSSQEGCILLLRPGAAPYDNKTVSAGISLHYSSNIMVLSANTSITSLLLPRPFAPGAALYYYHCRNAWMSGVTSDGMAAAA
jgi:hypothetical protein